MYLQTVFELTLVLDSEKFSKLINNANIEYLDDNRYVDNTLTSKGITVTYRDSQYKKKVKLTINPNWLLDNDKPNPNKFVRKLEKHVNSYFNSRYHLNDFQLTGITLTADIDVGNWDKVTAYLKILQRVGKVKGFSPSGKNWLDDNISFYLDGNSNGIEFMIYDLEGLLMGQLREAEHGRKQLKSIADKSKGLLRAEVRLTEPKAIRSYTDETDTSRQIADLSKKQEGIFFDTFRRIVPFGDFYKKDKAVEIIRKEVTDIKLRRRMLRLTALIPEKKSLLLAQKALDYRKIDEVMDEFTKINVSPITISKRHDVKELRSLYSYLD